MPEYSAHPPGTFCWPELATTDQNAAVAFYRALFGWDVNDIPLGPGETYSMLQLRGKPVAAAHTPRREDGANPPHWASYVSVVSADDSTRRARELGGTVVEAPFDVMDVGRMSVLQDPSGAVFALWQPKRHIGASIMGEPNTLCWTELLTTNLSDAETFYTQLFGWKPKPSSNPAMQYTEVSVDGMPQGGMMPMPPQLRGMPSQWYPYFAVTDCDGTAERARQSGANIYVPPNDVPGVGRFAIIADPQGAVFAIIQLARQ